MLAQPRSVIDQLPIVEGDVVVDVGAGVGAYAIDLARSVGRQGTVHAYDIQRDVIASLVHTASEYNITNIMTMTIDIENAALPLTQASVDGVLIAHTLFQIKDTKHVLAEVARILKPGGWCAVVEWRDSFQGIGPQPEYIVPEEMVHTVCDEVGLLYQNPLLVGTFQYGALFYKI
jgi:ubiquinone/menaquinone biosynthesis C-methylase UbiE